MGGALGDFAGLEAVIGKLEGMKDLVPKICDESAQGIEDAIARQFIEGVDPYGEPWAPLAESTIRRKGKSTILEDTGAMMASPVVVVTESSIEATVADPAGYHQEGGGNLPARPILPDETRGLPDSWEAAIVKAAEDVMNEEWGG